MPDPKNLLMSPAMAHPRSRRLRVLVPIILLVVVLTAAVVLYGIVISRSGSGADDGSRAPTIDEVPSTSVLCAPGETPGIREDRTVTCTLVGKGTTPLEHDWRRYGDIHAIRLALLSHQNIEGRFPSALDQLAPSYMQEVPVDPVSGTPYGYAMANGNFRLDFAFEVGIMAFAPGPHFLTPRGFDQENIGPSPEETRTTTGLAIIPPDASGTTVITTSDPFPEELPGDEDETDADLDADGLTDAYETGGRLDGGDPDTDDDGLADGDEVLVYGTDPLIADTDGDAFDDLTEVKGGYDPNGPGKPSEERAAEVAASAATYGLHEPTISNLAR